MTKIEMYMAEDGRVFNNEEDCIMYEKYEMPMNPETNSPTMIVPMGASLV